MKRTTGVFVAAMALSLFAVSGAGAQDRVQDNLSLNDLYRQSQKQHEERQAIDEYLKQQEQRRQQEQQDWDQKLRTMREIDDYNQRVEKQQSESRQTKFGIMGGALVVGIVVRILAALMKRS